MKMSDELKAHYRTLGVMGGTARAKALSAKRRKEIARMGGLARKKVLDRKVKAA